MGQPTTNGDAAAQALEDRLTIVMPDARGHGRTEVDSASFTLSDMVDDVAGLIEHLDLAPAVVMGHSMGAQMATELAARWPELVDRVVLEDPAYRISTNGGLRSRLFMGALRLGMRVMRHRSVAQIRRFADRSFKAWSDEDRATWAVAQHRSAQGTLDVLRGAMDRTRDWNVTLSQIEAPTLLVTSDKGLIKDDEAESVMAALPGGERAHITSAGHNIRRDNYTDFMAAVSPFIQG